MPDSSGTSRIRAPPTMPPDMFANSITTRIHGGGLDDWCDHSRIENNMPSQDGHSIAATEQAGNRIFQPDRVSRLPLISCRKERRAQTVPHRNLSHLCHSLLQPGIESGSEKVTDFVCQLQIKNSMPQTRFTTTWQEPTQQMRSRVA